MTTHTHRLGPAIATLCGALLLQAPGAAPRVSVILQCDDWQAAADAARRVGGEVTHELALIRSVAARLAPAQLEAALQADPALAVHENRGVAVASLESVEAVMRTLTHHALLARADLVHSQTGFTGSGVGVAFVDSGYSTKDELNRRADGANRIVASYDAQTDRSVLWQDNDQSGHATHVMSTAVSSYATSAWDQVVAAGTPSLGSRYHGIAPGATLIAVKAFDRKGRGTYADVIRGIDWVVANKDRYGIRVLNLSFSAVPRSRYWEDPLNHAVMAAWKAGIVVVASAGNGGPDAMTIGVPGNVPYVVTVGAVTDSYTADDPTDDRLASFSAAGPTTEGFVKPEIVAPGGHVMATMEDRATIAKQHPEFFNGHVGSYFSMSGTSQAAAVVSGVCALLLEAEPWLTPDQVKHRLMATARTAVAPDGSLGYSVFQQGAGLVDAHAALTTSTIAGANLGLDLDDDLAGVVHFRGRGARDSSGRYYIEGLEGFTWGGEMYAPAAGLDASAMIVVDQGYVWNEGFVWNDGFAWNDGFVWNEGFTWNEGSVWNEGFTWNESVGINSWVAQE